MIVKAKYFTLKAMGGVLRNSSNVRKADSFTLRFTFKYVNIILYHQVIERMLIHRDRLQQSPKFHNFRA